MKVLIIEDQENLAKLLKNGLESEGFTVDYILDGEVGSKRLALHHSDYDILILDLMLPKKSGLEICRELRERGSNLPLIMLTAKDGVQNITTGLNIGADDYLVKPFSFEVLLARIRALLRRPNISLPQELTVGVISLNPVSREVRVSGRIVHLTMKEFGILEHLMRNTGMVVSREQILSNSWDFSFDSFANVVDVHVTNLRKKLGTEAEKMIETVRGVGYRLNG